MRGHTINHVSKAARTLALGAVIAAISGGALANFLRLTPMDVRSETPSSKLNTNAPPWLDDVEWAA